MGVLKVFKFKQKSLGFQDKSNIEGLLVWKE